MNNIYFDRIHLNGLISAFAGIILCWFLPAIGIAQPTFNSYLLPNSVGARSGALAYSNVADAWSSGSMYINPAAPLFASHKAMVESSLYLEGNNAALSRLLFPLIASEDINFSTGISYRRSLTPNRLANRLQAHIPHQDYFRMDIGYSFKLSNTVGAGLLGGVAMDQTISSRSVNFIQGAGFYYAPSPALHYGIVYKGSFQETYQPLTGSDSTKQIHPHHVEIGLSLKYPNGFKDPFLRFSLSNLKIIGKNGLWYKGGLELWPYQTTAFRLGYASGPSADRFSTGLGLKFGNVMLDYSFGLFRKSDFRDYIHQLGISIKLR